VKDPAVKDPAVARGPAARLVSVHWERIQVIVRLRPAEAGSIDPATARLERLDDPSVMMAATRAWVDGEDVVIRCNVMQGPGGFPLAAGTWVLAADGRAPGPLGSGGAIRIADGAGEGGDRLAGARFATATLDYVVRPTIVGAHRHLDVQLERAPRRVTLLRSIRGLFVHFPRIVLFQSFALAYRVAARFVTRNPARILFIGHYGSELNGDMQAVLAGLAARGVDPGAIATVPPLRRRRLQDWARLPIELARAATIVIEEDVLFMLPSIPARIVQLWHASGALKAIGYSRVGKPSARSPWSRHYRYFTWAIVSGEHDVPLFAEAFGMPEDRVLPLGHPRMDRFFDPAFRERAREATLVAFPIARGRRMILFAPTWRQQGTARVYDLSVLDYGRLYELCVELDAVFVIRMHPTVRHPVDIPPAFADRIVNGTTTVMDAPEQLCATDLLITDYSSIILEYSLLGRPMLFFAPDLDEYRADRDVYMPYEEFVPGRIVRTFDELVAAIRAQDFQLEKVEPFARSQFTYVDGRATERVVDLLLGQ
jgi:CDP-glycerol glycerophosphotransferase (TagB/SpsB family)